MELGISQVGLPDTDAQRLKTMMAMAVTSGTLKHRWVMKDASIAHLVVLTPDSVETVEVGTEENEWKVYAVLAGESDEFPRNLPRLPWPIRLEELLQLLLKVEKKAEATPNGHPISPGVAAGPDNHLIRLASMLRESAAAASGNVWKVEGIGRRPLHISAGTKEFFYNDSLDNLRSLRPDVELNFVPLPIEDLPAKDGRRPLLMLQWLVGLQTAPLGLLPWIKTDCALKLKRYPAFQVLHHTMGHRRVAAALARPRKDPRYVAELTGQDIQTVIGFINAVNLCGYLIMVEKSASSRTGKRGLTGSRRALFSSLRKALGIAPSHA